MFRHRGSPEEGHGEERLEGNILSKLSNIFQQPKQSNFDKPNTEFETQKNEDMSKTLATLLTLPTNKLEETMNNELNTQQSHINSEYFSFFHSCVGYVCVSAKTEPSLSPLKTLKIRKFLNFNTKSKQEFSFFSPRMNNEKKS